MASIVWWRPQDGVAFESWVPPSDSADMTPIKAFGTDFGGTFVRTDSSVGVAQGWVYNDGSFTAPKPTAPVASPPNTVSDRQFAQQAAVAGMISQDEALAWVGPGAIPAPLMKLIDALPSEVRFSAKMLLSGATSFERLHPLTAQLAQAFGWKDADRDAFWTAAAAL